ncbi:MAG: hypothetical protein LBF22_15025, partial [Deltaproteobacteria bacterium]|nr:hypothetical protein [Deltaproteobacteria bacterium]
MIDTYNKPPSNGNISKLVDLPFNESHIIALLDDIYLRPSYVTMLEKKIYRDISTDNHSNTLKYPDDKEAIIKFFKRHTQSYPPFLDIWWAALLDPIKNENPPLENSNWRQLL